MLAAGIMVSEKLQSKATPSPKSNLGTVYLYGRGVNTGTIPRQLSVVFGRLQTKATPLPSFYSGNQYANGKGRTAGL